MSDNFFKTREDYTNYFTRKKNEIIDKNQLIEDLCREKKVLDLGCIDHSSKTAIELGENWLHKKIKNIARELVGVDILENDALKLNKLGYNIICADVESFNLNETFDVIVAGDLIEHLSNIGLFFESVSYHMNQDTIFVITTPNPFNIEQTMYALFHNRIVVHDQHTVWISPQNFWELSSRNKMRIVDFYWIDTRFKFGINRKWFKIVVNGISRYIMKKRQICNRDYAIILRKL